MLRIKEGTPVISKGSDDTDIVAQRSEEAGWIFLKVFSAALPAILVLGMI